jgi:hypothetical protein
MACRDGEGGGRDKNPGELDGLVVLRMGVAEGIQGWSLRRDDSLHRGRFLSGGGRSLEEGLCCIGLFCRSSALRVSWWP